MGFGVRLEGCMGFLFPFVVGLVHSILVFMRIEFSFMSFV